MSKNKASAFRTRAVVVSTWWPWRIKADFAHKTSLPSQKVLSRGGGGGSNFDNFFLVDDGREDPNTTISGPSLARQQNTI